MVHSHRSAWLLYQLSLLAQTLTKSLSNSLTLKVTNFSLSYHTFVLVWLIYPLSSLTQSENLVTSQVILSVHHSVRNTFFSYLIIHSHWSAWALYPFVLRSHSSDLKAKVFEIAPNLASIFWSFFLDIFKDIKTLWYNMGEKIIRNINFEKSKKKSVMGRLKIFCK